METIKVMPWGKGQGEYVLINREDLTDKHVLYEDYPLRIAEEAERARQEAEKQAQADAQKRADDALAQLKTEDPLVSGQSTPRAPTKEVIIERLKAANIEHDPRANKADLLALLPPDQQV